MNFIEDYALLLPCFSLSPSLPRLSAPDCPTVPRAQWQCSAQLVSSSGCRVDRVQRGDRSTDSKPLHIDVFCECPDEFEKGSKQSSTTSGRQSRQLSFSLSSLPRCQLETCRHRREKKGRGYQLSKLSSDTAETESC